LVPQIKVWTEFIISTLSSKERSGDPFEPPFCNTTSYKCSCFPNVIDSWNLLDVDTQNQHSRLMFKKQIRSNISVPPPILPNYLLADGIIIILWNLFELLNRIRSNQKFYVFFLFYHMNASCDRTRSKGDNFILECT
jgi:hypothetical protein